MTAAQFTPTLRKVAFRARWTVAEVLLPVAAVIAALLVGTLIISFAGLNPLRAYATLAGGAFGSIGSFSETLVRFCPLALCALGVLVAPSVDLFALPGLTCSTPS